jgi:outer membrane protein assembly factor BamB
MASHGFYRLYFSLVAITLCGGLSGLPSLSAADWGQLLGPTRTGTSSELLPNKLGDLKPRWSYDVGAGFAGPAVVGKQAIIFHRVGTEVLLDSIDVTTGKRLWRYKAETSYEGGYNTDNGPRCVPAVSNGHVFAFGPDATLHCTDLKGTLIWKRQLGAEHKAPDGYFGAGATPLVVDDRVFVCLGGRDSAALLGLDSATGKTIWQSEDDQISYASPILFDVAGKQQILFLTRQRLVALDPKLGTVVWQHPFGKPGLVVTGCTPLAIDNRVFLTASYNIGAEMLDLKSGSPKLLWGDDKTLSSQYTNVVHHAGYLYGTHGREDGGPAELRCVEAGSGKVQWSESGFSVSHTIIAGDKLLIQSVKSGEVILAQTNAKTFQELGRVKVTNDLLRASPALANNTLYVRTNDRTDQGVLLAMPLK